MSSGGHADEGEGPTAERRYLSRLDTALASLGETASLADLLRHSQGAFPSLVAERLAMLGSAELAQRLLFALADPPPQHPGHELHVLDYEWYFTSETADAIAARCNPGTVLCLGSPTVAATLDTVDRQVLLLDRNPATLHEAKSWNPAVVAIQADFSEEEREIPQADTVVLDPPWYADETIRWLSFAARHARVGATLIVPMPLSLVRPSAPGDREHILAFSQFLGEVTVVPGVLVYETPTFEYEVLRDRGIQLSQSWRAADLLQIVLRRRPIAVDLIEAPMDDGAWSTHYLYGQTVKVRIRNGAKRATARLIEEPPGCERYFLPSVSRRDRRRQEIDVWTSRNRVARVGDMATFLDVLHSLQSGTSARVSELALPEQYRTVSTVHDLAVLFDVAG